MKHDGEKIDSDHLRELCIKHGADDIGIVEIDRPSLSLERADILHAFPRGKTLVCMVRKINADSVRTPASYIKDTEFNHLRGEIIAISRKILSDLDEEGVGGLLNAATFRWMLRNGPGRCGASRSSLWLLKPASV